ncbi:MAG: peptidoglycan synthetase [Bacteroidales bacterium]|nr:peptidoglycan synthetase [Bacteroidales bacterium]MCF8334594.1 peptidoglycan synthetase [Bacteroidales bacterium]
MQRIHFIAIGGSAMHNLAIALHKKGYEITGSDDEIFEPSRSRLSRYNLLPPEEGWRPERIHNNLDAVLVGMHAKKDNPELRAARQKNLPVFSFPEYLYEHAKNKKRIVIGGSHGKTTNTAMILHVLHALDKPCDFMVGAQLEGFETMVSLSSEADIMILEGDEYLTSPLDARPKFHVYKPHTAVITGIAWDHMNVFPTFENYLEQFRLFIRQIDSGGSLFYCREDEHLPHLVENTPGPAQIESYSLPPHFIEDGVTYLETSSGNYPLKIFGRHNLLNMEAARLVCDDLGINDSDFYHSISTFGGASHRLEKVHESEDFVLYRDFAHAPSKVKATLQSVREQYPSRKLVAVFELHTYSSLNKSFLPQYQGTMDEADIAAVFFNPHTLELKRLPALGNYEVKKAFDRSDLQVFTDSDALRRFLKQPDYHNAAVLIMSSGNLGGINVLDELLSLD